MAERGPTQTTDGSVEVQRWAQRPALARAARVGVALLPLMLSIGFSYAMSHLLPPARLGVNKWLWWVGLICVTTLLMSRIDRFVRRLAPMSALLQLSLVFPDEAPSRYKTAMRSFSARKVQTRLDAMREAGFQLNEDESRSQAMLDLLAMLSDHDRRTRGHSERVRAYADMIGRELKLPDRDMEKLQWAALLHDLGKLTVPSQILNKDGRPDEAEWKLLQGHPAAGVPLAAPIAEWLGEWIAALSMHHERWDGNGYPDGVGGKDIPLAARIVSIADAYDVMTSSRSYKKAFPAEVAREEIAKGAGSQFCPVTARAFLAIPASRLKAVAGPISWMGGLPGLRNVPVAEVVSSSTVTAASAALSAVTAVGVIPQLAPLPAAAETEPVVAVAETTTTLAPSTTATPTTADLPDEPADLVIELPTVGFANTIPQTNTTTTVPRSTTTTTPRPSGTTTTTTTSPAPTTTTTTAPPAPTTTTTAPAPTTTTTTAPPAPGAPVIGAGQTFSVSEAAAIGAPVGTVAATDPDSPITGFSITGGDSDGVFAIDAGGAITIADDDLDHETTPSYTLTVTATDGTNTSAPTSVIVDVVDANELAPVVDPGQSFVVSEASTVPTPVGTVTASDADSPITGFTITAGNGDGVFAIDNGGTITVADTTNLDHETTPTYLLTVTATDGEFTSAPETVQIIVADANDEPPVVDPAQVFVVLESATTGTSVGTVTASDPDSPITGFAIVSGNGDGIFAIDAAGELTIADDTALDFETASVHLLGITATDGPNTSAARTVTVNVTDVPEAGTLLISEFRTTGPGGAADDFIELYNPTASPVSIVGWSIQIYNGSGSPVDVPFALGTGAVTSVAPNSYYLLTGSSYTGPTPGDQPPFGSNIAIGGGVELISDVATTVDTVGSASTGTLLPRMQGSVEQSYERLHGAGLGHCKDTDADTDDFVHLLVTSTPQNSTAPAQPCGTPPPSITPGGPGHLVISELRTSGPGGPNDEFVELFNPTNAAVDLIGHELRKSDNTLVHVFGSSVILGPGHHYTLAGPGFTGPSDAPYSETQTFASNGSVKLTDGVSDLDVVGMSAGGAFETQPLPPMTTSGTNDESYERIGANCQDTDDNGADFRHNLASSNPQVLTDPATPCPIFGLGMVVSEFSTGDAHREGDFVELYNSSGSPIDISGWEVRLSDDVAIFETVTIPGSTMVPAGGFYLLGLNGSKWDIKGDSDVEFATPLPANVGIGIHDGVGYVDQLGTRARPEPHPTILSASLLGEGTGVSPIDPAATTEDQSIQRRAHYGGGHCVDTGDNAADFFSITTTRHDVLNSLSPPRPCAPPASSPSSATGLVIKEIRTDGPASGQNEFIEIFNPTGAPIAMGGLELRDADGDLEFTWPVMDLQPGQHYLIGGAGYGGPTDGTYAVDGVPNGGAIWIWDPVGLIVVDDVDFGTSLPNLPILGGRLLHSYERLGGGCLDTGVHTDDFERIYASTPSTTADPFEPCPVTYFLHTDVPGTDTTSSTPAHLPMTATAPAEPTLYNYDTDRDTDPGLRIERSNFDPGSFDNGNLDEFQWWGMDAVSPIALTDDVSLTVWATLAGFVPAGEGSVGVHLLDCTTSNTGCVIVAGGTAEHAQGADWLRYDISFADPDYTIAAGRRLLVRIQVVNGMASHPMNFAYGTRAHPSGLTIG